MAIKVSVENTPNPSTLIFRFSEKISGLEGPVDFPTAQEAEDSPLASKIFGFPWAQGVLLGPDFISVSKQDWVEWEVLAEPLANIIEEHLAEGLPVYLKQVAQDDSENDSPLVRKIKRTLQQEIRPAVAYDGGDVLFANFADGRLFLQFKGACSGCPSKSVTLKEGIETRMKELYPEILEVVGI